MISQRLLRTLVPITFSVLAAAALLFSIDLDEFHGLASRVRWQLLPSVIGVMAMLVVLFGLRWYVLLRKTCRWWPALMATAIGLAGNQILPARGGDIVRAVYSARWAGASVHQSLSALLIEKMIDLLAVGVIGTFALIFLLNHGNTGSGLDSPLAIAASLVLLVGVFLVLARSGALRRILGMVARWLRLSPRWYRHAFRQVFHLERASTLRALAAPVLLSTVMWLGPYTYVFRLLPEFAGVDIPWSQALVLLFVTSIGLALPAAPSGIGTVHVAIVSGFLLIGRSAGEGLVVATVIHVVFFIGFGLSGLLALICARFDIGRHAHNLEAP